MLVMVPSDGRRFVSPGEPHLMEVSVQIRTIGRMFLGTALFLTAAAPAAAQAPEVGVSYSFLRMTETNAPAGFAVDFAKAVAPLGTGSLGVVGEFGLNRFTSDVGDWTTTSYLGGVRFSGPSAGPAQLFGQFLLGAMHGEGYTDFAIQPGVGVKFRANEQIDFRTQVDFPVDFYDGGNDAGFRLNFGIVFKIGQ